MTVVDASGLIDYLLGDGRLEVRNALVGDAHAPAFVDVEVQHALRGGVRGRRVDLAAASAARRRLFQLPIVRHPDRSLLDAAWDLRDRCTTYDALYVALAQRLDVPLLTTDAPLSRGVADIVDVRLLD